VKYKRNIHALFLLSLSKSQQGLRIVNQRIQFIFVSDEIESYSDDPQVSKQKYKYKGWMHNTHLRSSVENPSWVQYSPQSTTPAPRYWEI
jgi:hypothetical protein